MPVIPTDLFADLAEVTNAAKGDERWFVLVPVENQPGRYVAVFADGSWTYWIPREPCERWLPDLED